LRFGLAGERLLVGQCGRSALFEGLTVDEMALVIEVMLSHEPSP
jgi:hypothetical protein